MLSGEGFRLHPCLICDILFIDHRQWLEMPRCVSILKEAFNVPIKLSTAYTENYKVGTAQRMWGHHHGKNINPGISLRRLTRDGQKKRSINSHFATTYVRYTLEDFIANNGAIIARDKKN